MKRFLTCVIALGLAASAWAFPTNILTDSVNLDNLKSDFREWRFEHNAEEDAMFSLDMRNNSGPLTVSDYAWTFRVSRRVAGGSNLTYVAIDNADITKATSNVTFAIAWSNIPPANVYNTELRMTQGNSARNAGQGTWEVNQSLYTGDGTFSFPAHLAASDFYAVAGDTLEGTMDANGNNITGDVWSGRHHELEGHHQRCGDN